MKHMKKQNGLKIIPVVCAALIAVGVIAWLVVPKLTSGKSSIDDRPLTTVLTETTKQDDVGSWLDTLDDEQKAAIEIAYEASVAEGYTGSLEEWAASELRSYVDGNGDMVVLLPDGGEFTVHTAKTEDAPAESAQGEAPNPTEGEQGEEGAPEGTPEGEEPAPEGEEVSTELVPRIHAEKVQAHKGDKSVSVPIRIDDNPGVLGMTFSVSYDDSALTLVKADNGPAFAGVLTMTHSREYASGCLFTWDGVDLAEGDVKDGAILTLTFDVSSKASGVYPIAVRGVSAFGSDLNEISISVVDGNVAVG